MMNGLFGIGMDRKVGKEIIRTGNEMVNGFHGMRMDRRREKNIGRMGKGLKLLCGTKMGKSTNI